MHSDIRPIPATRAETLPGPVPTVSPPARRGVAGHSAANLPQRAQREPCCGCSCTDWVEAHYSLGRIWCLTCYQGSQRPATSMVPTPAGRAQLELWIRGAP
jgi:hypothetical protein